MEDPVHSLILRRLASVRYEEVARVLGRDVAHVSRIASGERGIRVDEIGPFLRAIGIPVEWPEVDGAEDSNERIHALLILARDSINNEIERRKCGA